MYKYKVIFGLLIFQTLLVFAAILCSGKGLTQLLYRQNFNTTSGRTVTINVDNQSYAKGFTLKSFNTPSEGLCVSVDPYHFWQSGIEASVLKRTLISNFKITVNQKPIPRFFIMMNAGSTTEFQKTDVQGKVLGYYSAPFIPCFTTVFLSADCYDVSIHEAGFFGQVEDYSVQLCIREAEMNRSS